MDRLYAPWRLNYITQSASDKAQGTGPTSAPPTGCIFCDKPAEDLERDEANFIVARGNSCFVILNAFPYNNGHLMVVPYRHLASPDEMNTDECTEMMTTAAHLTRVLRDAYRCDGFNIGMNVGSAAGAGIAAHLHLHLVPRWSGDTNFMPALGDVKVLPETLPQTWIKVRAAL